jgi:peptidoglycan hydrolase-like protein with peptidoglycan-binding domain
MPNPSLPTISEGAMGAVVRRLQRALRRTPNLGIVVDGVFGLLTETAVVEFQKTSGLLADGVVGPATWNALPDGAPMPTLEEGSYGEVIRALQTVLTSGAPGAWGTTPKVIDGDFGPLTKASVEAFQSWGVCQSTGSSVTKPGQSPCALRTPPWRPKLASSSSSVDEETRRC